MTWYPLSFLPTQYNDNAGVPYSGAVLKAYAETTNNVIAMATDYNGLTTATSFALNALGFPVSDANAVIIPHVQENYKIALYPDQASADTDSGALWTVDENQIADAVSTAFLQAFSGDGTTTDFILSTALGNDEKTLMVFADRIREYSTNGAFASDVSWTKGTGWTIAAGAATATGAISTDIDQDAGITIIEGESYTITFTVANQSAGGVIPKIGGVQGTERTADGTYSETIIAGSTQKIAFEGNGYTGDIDNVSVTRVNSSHREILRNDEFTLDGTSLTFNEAPSAGTNNILVFAPSLLLGEAGASAAAAAISEANAAASASKLQGTSITSNVIGTGSKTFTTQENKFFDAGSWVLITSDADPTNYMHGQVTSYSSTTLIVNITNTGGSGTLADWGISVSGSRGAQGTTGTVSGASAITPVVSDKVLLLDTDDSDALGHCTVTELLALNTTVPQNHITGLTLSNDADTAHDINVTPGQATDSTNASYLTLTSEMTKQIDASWAVGDDAGGLFSGTVAPNTTYHVFLIEKGSDGSIDIGFDTSVTAANIPTGYTKYRRIGSVVTDTSSNILQFTQRGDQFELITPVMDLSTGLSGTSANTGTLASVPDGIEVEAKLNVATNSNGSRMYVSSLTSADLAPSQTLSPLSSSNNGSATTTLQPYPVSVWTNTSAQFRYRTGTSVNVYVVTLGWNDLRGK